MSEKGSACGKLSTFGRKEKALRRKYFLLFLPYAFPFPSTSTVLRLKIEYAYKKLVT